MDTVGGASGAAATTATTSSGSKSGTVLTSKTTAAALTSPTTTGHNSGNNGDATPTATVSSNSGATAAPPTVLVSTGLPVSFPSSAGPPPRPPVSITPQQMLLEETNNWSSLGATGTSEGQQSLSAAPSLSSSPNLSPQGKIFGRNANGTMIATSRPSNEAEVQLYRVLQRASLLTYYDTLLEMGGDDVQQLYEAGEEEFLEIMALVGMASKPLHVRRLQKALHEWASNTALFQAQLGSVTMAGLCETPTKAATQVFKQEQSPSFARTSRFANFAPSPAIVYNPTPLIQSVSTPSLSTAAPFSQTVTYSSTPHFLSQLQPAIGVPVIHQSASQLPPSHAPLIMSAAASPLPLNQQSIVVPHSSATTHQVTSSSPQLTPVLTETQLARILLGAEKIACQLPQREPRAQTSKKRANRELEAVIAMSEHDPRRMEEIRKYSAIYGRFDCKRRPEKPLTLHEVCVNEAAAQLCRLMPTLLTHRVELFPLARQIIKDVGFGHSASIARYGGLIPQLQQQSLHTADTPAIQPRSSVVIDCESSESMTSGAGGGSNGAKRKRLTSTETPAAMADLSRESTTAEDSRYNLFAMYQKFAKPPFDLSDVAKFSFGKTDLDEQEDNDSRFSFNNNSGSPPLAHNSADVAQHRWHLRAAVASTSGEVPSRAAICSSTLKPMMSYSNSRSIGTRSQTQQKCDLSSSQATVSETGVQIISAAAAGQIIAVANPALVMSPTLNESMNLKYEADLPES